MHGSRRPGLAAITLSMCFWWTAVLAGLPLETETARLLPKGWFKLDTAVEYQTSTDGTETDVPLALEYGFTDKLELLVEPVPYVSIRPKMGPSASGIGDLEVTLTHLLDHETRSVPAFALAGEIKFPTTKNKLIGTGKTDYTPYIIASKKLGRFDVHANLGYTFTGQPSGSKLKNTINYGLAGEYHFDPKWDLVAECIGNTSSLPSSSENPDGGSGGGESAVTPEAAGGERSGLVGARYILKPGMYFSLGVVYDNNSAWLVRSGFTFRFK